MPTHDLPEVSEPSTAAVDPCTAARCCARAVTAVVLRLGTSDVEVRCCAAHAQAWSASARARHRPDLSAAR